PNIPDDLYYLVSGFEPTKLTMPKLRGILVKHDVEYPSKAKKADLVALFRARVVAQRDAILADQAKVRPAATGIKD
ncbi:hypothetical protein CONLIGDRAFT_554943, partial [Coniochaeta ligniaria NRRL 30616]